MPWVQPQCYLITALLHPGHKATAKYVVQNHFNNWSGLCCLNSTQTKQSDKPNIMRRSPDKENNFSRSHIIFNGHRGKRDCDQTVSKSKVIWNGLHNVTL